MSNNPDPGFFRQLGGLARDYLSHKRRTLQNKGTPQTRVDSGGNIGRSSFESQDIDRGDLRDVKEIRESGGVISQLVHAKALMQFGTGVEFQSDNDPVAEYLNDELNDIDNLVIDIGEDAIWYPYSIAEIVETNGGGFSHVELVEPWTMLPLENEFGDVVGWEQEIAGDYGTNVERFEPDELAQFILNKSSGRDKTGISEVIRAEDEINQYRNDMRAISNAVEIAGFRRHLWKVGREGGMVIDDNELRRVRNLVDSMKGDTQFVMGQDVDHELMESQDVSQFKTITEIDMRNLALALGVPIELASVISEGLGSGEQSGVRWQAFMLDTMASQRALADQFIQQIVRPILEQYSPFSRDENVELVFGDPVQDAQTKQTEVNAIGSDMTVNERRALFDREPLDDEEIGEGFDSPGEGEAGEGGDGGPFGGLFSDQIEKKVQEELESRELEDSDLSLEEYEAYLENVWSGMICGEDTTRTLVEFAESELPQTIKNNLETAIWSTDAVFSQFDTLADNDIVQLREFLSEELTSSGGWTIDSLAGRLQDLHGELDESEAEKIARSETQSITNHAYEVGLEERGVDLDEELFYWVSTNDDRRTEACEWLTEQTNPDSGGDPVTLEELKELIQEAPDHDSDVNTEPRTYSPHIQCRSRFVRHID